MSKKITKTWLESKGFENNSIDLTEETKLFVDVSENYAEISNFNARDCEVLGNDIKYQHQIEEIYKERSGKDL